MSAWQLRAIIFPSLSSADTGGFPITINVPGGGNAKVSDLRRILRQHVEGAGYKSLNRIIYCGRVLQPDRDSATLLGIKLENGYTVHAQAVLQDPTPEQRPVYAGAPAPPRKGFRERARAYVISWIPCIMIAALPVYILYTLASAITSSTIVTISDSRGNERVLWGGR